MLIDGKMAIADETAKLSTCCLPGDVIVEILLRLPVKSLSRFKVVSKSWYGFLNSRAFVQMHFGQPHHEKLLRVSDRGPRDTPTISFFTLTPKSLPNDGDVVVYSTEDGDGDHFDRLDLNFPCFPDDEVRVVGSCNGLLCVHFSRSSSIVLWNPATRKYRFLDLPESVSFYCDPFFPYVMLGYVPESDDYKVVKVPSSRKNMRGNDARVWVYTLSSDSWEERGVMNHGLSPKGGSAVTLNGCLYWMSCNGNGLDAVTSFDLSEQVFGEITLPNSDITDLTIRKLVVLKGCLSMIIYSASSITVDHYEVWVMTEQQGVPQSWTKPFEFSPFTKLARPVGSWRDCELLFGYPNGLSHELLSYNLFTKTTRSFQRRSSVGGFKVINYVESLESVNTGN